MKRRLLQLVVVAIVLVFWGLYLSRSWGQLQGYPWRVDLLRLFLALVAGLAYWLSLGLAWHRALRALHGQMSLRAALGVWLRSMFMRYIPGNVWHVMARVYLAERQGQSRHVILVSTLAEQILMLVGSAVAFALSLPTWAEAGRGWLALLVIVPIGLLVLHPSVLTRGVALAGRVLRRPVPSLTVRYRDLLRLLPWYVAPNLLGGISLALCLAAIGPVSPGGLPALVGVFAAGWMVGYLSFFTPGGLGVREGALALMLAPAYGPAPAIVASLLSRLVVTVGEALLVALWQLRAGQQSAVTTDL